jgi:hypothetical protein
LVVSTNSVCENKLLPKNKKVKMDKMKRVDFFINKPTFDQRINKSNKYLFTNALEKYLFPKKESPLCPFNGVVRFGTF